MMGNMTRWENKREKSRRSQAGIPECVGLFPGCQAAHDSGKPRKGMTVRFHALPGLAAGKNRSRSLYTAAGAFSFRLAAIMRAHL